MENRVIKFRAWDELNKEMHHERYEAFNSLKPGDILNRYSIVMQFTGLTDKNGKEIYEGDIVRCGYGYGSVIFNAGCFMVEWIDDKEAMMELLFSRDGKFSRRYKEDFFEVIGNIYETTPQHDRIGLSITEPDNEIINSVYVKDYDRESNFDNGIVAQGIEPREINEAGDDGFMTPEHLKV